MNEMPEVLKALIWLVSPNEPKNINEEIRTAKGKDSGTNRAEAKNISWKIWNTSRPFPTKSSTYFQRNCISKKKTQRKNIKKNLGT